MHLSQRLVPHHGQTVVRDVGLVLHVPGAMALVSVPVALLWGETVLATPFLATAAVALGLGQALYRLCRRAPPMRLRHAMVTAVLAWTVIPLVGTLPFLLTPLEALAGAATAQSMAPLSSFINALFESVSGFTSTGLTMVALPSELPHVMQWWRSLMQWIGGVGVIVVMLTVLHPAGDAERLYFSEGHELTPVSDVGDILRRLWWVYLLYTGLGVLLLLVTGMPWWAAVNYAMTAIATGGFGITDNSLADFGTAAQAATLFIMLAGAVSFSVHYRMLSERRVAPFWQAPENRVLLAIVALAALAVGVENAWYGAPGTWFDALFQVTAAVTTSGFGTVPLRDWSPTALLILSMGMLCGGAAGATTGGLKLKRVILLARGAYDRIRGVVLHPWRLMEHKPMADEAAEHRAVRALEAAAIMLVLVLIAALIGTLLLLHSAGADVPLEAILLETCSALGNVGLSAGITDPALPDAGKVGLIVMMWAGRLEIVPALVLLAALVVSLRRAVTTTVSRRD